MLLSILMWIVFGALAGWIASLLMGTDREQGAIANIVVGIVGAIIGGFLVRLIGGGGISGFNLSSLLIAVIGASILLGVARLFVRQ